MPPIDPDQWRRHWAWYKFPMKAFSKALLATVAALAAIVATTSESLADFRVCNRTDQRIDVAFGYPHPQFSWSSEGWWTIQPGDCRMIYRGALSNRYYYLYATGSAGAIWEGPESQIGGFFCVQPEKFVFSNTNFIHDGAINCEHHNLQGKRFFLVDTEGRPNHIHNLTSE